MSNAWETTVEDVLNVCNMRLNMGLSEESAEIILSDLNHKAIEHAALFGLDMEGQTNYAYEEIEAQINLMVIAETNRLAALGKEISEGLKKLFQSGG